MEINFHKLSLTTKILILIDKYSANFYNDVEKTGLRSGDLVFILNKEEFDCGTLLKDRTPKEEVDKIIEKLTTESILEFPLGQTENYYHIKKFS